jgi:uncharacterized membrane protein
MGDMAATFEEHQFSLDSVAAEFWRILAVGMIALIALIWVNTPQRKLFRFSKMMCLPHPMAKEIYLKFQRSMKVLKILKYSKTQAKLRH